MLKRQQARFPKDVTLFFAKNGHKSLEIIQSESIDLLITELALSDIDAIELMANITVHHPLLKITFFLPENYGSLKNLPSVHLVQKPNKVEDVIRFVRDVTDIELQAL